MQSSSAKKLSIMHFCFAFMPCLFIVACEFCGSFVWGLPRMACQPETSMMTGTVPSPTSPMLSMPVGLAAPWNQPQPALLKFVNLGSVFERYPELEGNEIQAQVFQEYQ